MSPSRSFAVAHSGQLGAAARCEVTEMQSGNNLHRFKIYTKKKKRLTLPAYSTKYFKRMLILYFFLVWCILYEPYSLSRNQYAKKSLQLIEKVMSFSTVPIVGSRDALHLCKGYVGCI